MSDDDCRYDGGSSRRLLAAVWTISRRITTPESSSLCCGLAVLRSTVDGRVAGAVSVLPRSAARLLLGSVPCIVSRTISFCCVRYL